jgi:hypothetical protein
MTPRRPEDFLQDISRKFSQTSPHLPNVISAASFQDQALVPVRCIGTRQKVR